MEIEARYVKVSNNGVDYTFHSTILNYSWIDNELAVLSKAKLFNKDHTPNCRFSDLIEYNDGTSEDDKDKDMFYLDEIADNTMFYTISNPDPSTPIPERPSISTYSNLSRSKVITLLLDEDVSHVKFIDKDDNEVIYEIDSKYVPFKKLFVVVSSAVDDFNLIKSIHELSDHPHYNLESDVVTISNAVPGDLYDGLIDLRNNTVLGSSETEINII